MRLELRVLLILAPALLVAAMLYPRYGPEASVLGGGWIFGTLSAYLAIPLLAKREVVAEQIREEGPLAELRTRERVAIIAAVTLKVKEPFDALKLELEPLTRRTTLKGPDGKEIEGSALDATLHSVVNTVNDLSAWIGQPDGLAAMLHAAVATANSRDYAAEMGAAGNEAQRAAAVVEANNLGDQTAAAIRYRAAHPELVQQGLRVQQTEEAIDEALGMFGAPKGGAIRKWATARATENLALGGPPGYPPAAGGVRPGKQGPIPL